MPEDAPEIKESSSATERIFADHVDKLEQLIASKKGKKEMDALNNWIALEGSIDVVLLDSQEDLVLNKSKWRHNVDKEQQIRNINITFTRHALQPEQINPDNQC